MAWQAAPTATANNANQNYAQPLIGGYGVGPTQVVPTTMQAAPQPLAVFQPTPVGYPIG